MSDWVIVAFTFFLARVAWLQHRLETRTAQETIEALAITKTSADAATVSANASVAALALATQNQRLEYQPYLDFGSVEIVADPHLFGGELHFNVRCEVRNIGKTPVRNLQLEVIYDKSWADTDGFSDQALNHERLPIKGVLQLRTLAAGQTDHLTGQLYTATIPQLREVADVAFTPTGSNVWFDALLQYADVFSGEAVLKRGRANGVAHHYSGLAAHMGRQPNRSPLSVRMFPHQYQTKV